MGDRLRQARLLRGLGVNELDRVAKLAVGTTSRLEHGDRGKRGSSGATVAKLASVLKVRVEWLLSGTEPMEAPSTDEVPNRAAAAALAREAGVLQEAIDDVLLEAVPPEDTHKPTLWWANRMQRRQFDLMQPGCGGAKRR